MRRLISAATNKSEHFNRYAQWVSFGGGGLVAAAARDEQRKMIKYNHLIANLLIFHTIVGMTNALDAIVADGRRDAVSDETLAALSPYQTEHINRFGNYILDLSHPGTAALRPPGPDPDTASALERDCVRFWRESLP